MLQDTQETETCTPPADFYFVFFPNIIGGGYLSISQSPVGAPYLLGLLKIEESFLWLLSQHLAQVERHLCRKKLIVLEKSSLIFCLGNKLGKSNGPQPYTAGFQESTYQISQNKRIVGLLQGWQRNPTSPEIPAQCCIQMKKVFEGNGSFQSQYFPPQQ